MRCMPLLLVVLSIGLAHPLPAAELELPANHPRLWFGNAERLAQARSYYQLQPFTPSGSDATRLNQQRALRGLLTGADADCDLAVDYLAGWQVSGNFRDALRQQGDALLQIYDWCHHRLSGEQIASLVARWNGYLDQENADGFANQGSEANNYFWGRVANNLAWGIASFGDNPRAQEYIDNALDLRLDTWFARWYADFGRGGVFPEGGDYGAVMLSYPLIPFFSATDFGFDPFARTAFFDEAIYALIYATTPGSSPFQDGSGSGQLLFPFNDDENFRHGGVINARHYLGDFARSFGVRDAESARAGHIRAWLAKTGAGRSWLFDALGGDGDPGDLDALPLDYYAAGSQTLSLRDRHDQQAMQLQLQLGTPGGIEHRHLDGGSFQLWRRGRWLSRESVGYAERLAGFAGSGSVDTEHALAHNTLLFQGRSTARWIGRGPHVIAEGADRGEQPRGLPRVLRLHHSDDFAFVAVDYSAAYRNPVATRVDWPYAEVAIREFLFLRQLNVVLILDRLRASSDSLLPFYASADWIERNDPLAAQLAAEQVTRTFVMHFETAPQLAASALTASIGEQVVDLITLLPDTPNYRVVDEDAAGNAAAGQFRLELDSQGSAESYFLNVISGRDSDELAVTASLQDLGDRWLISLQHPERGSASVQLARGMSSRGGSVSLNGAAASGLNDEVQTLSVDRDGPRWQRLPPARVFRDGFEAAH